MPVFGPWVRRNGANLWTSGAQDMQAAASLLVPASAGYAPTADASLGYDTTRDVFVAGGAGALAGSLSRVLARQFSSTDSLAAATITTNETAFAYSFPLPANYFIAGRLIRVTWYVEDVASAGAPTGIFRVRLQKAGPTNVNFYANAATAPTSSVTASYGNQVILAGTAAPGAAVVVDCLAQNGLNLYCGRNSLTQGITCDTTAAQAIQFTQQFGAGTAGNTVTLRQVVIEELA